MGWGITHHQDDEEDIHTCTDDGQSVGGQGKKLRSGQRSWWCIHLHWDSLTPESIHLSDTRGYYTLWKKRLHSKRRPDVTKPNNTNPTSIAPEASLGGRVLDVPSVSSCLVYLVSCSPQSSADCVDKVCVCYLQSIGSMFLCLVRKVWPCVVTLSASL